MLRKKFNKTNLYWLLVLFSILLLYGCQSAIFQSPTPISAIPNLSNQKLSLRGTIMNVYTSNNLINGIYAEGKIEPDTTYDKARIAITDKTKIFIKTNNAYMPTNKDALIIGLKIEVLFYGEIGESDPIRTSAAEIVILK